MIVTDDKNMTIQDSIQIYYARCPVPTASGIAFHQGMFDNAFAGTNYQVRNLKELGSAYGDAHYTHSIEYFFREGGGSPPIWARANGVDSQLLGITFMEELLGIFVRVDDSADSVADLAGRRVALPVWPKLIFDFWRFAAEKGVHSALKIHGLTEQDIRTIDIVEDVDLDEQRESTCVSSNAVCVGYNNQLQALLGGDIDAMFAKGADAALLEQMAKGRIRLLYDIRKAADINDRVNNSTPRLLTSSKHLWEEHPDAVIRYVQALLQAARWALEHRTKTRELVAIECGIDQGNIERYFQHDYETRFSPAITPQLLDTVDVMKSFLHKRGYIASDFLLDDWINPEPLAEALRREKI